MVLTELGKQNLAILLALFGAFWPGLSLASVTPTAKDFSSAGKNRAAIQTERKPLAERLDVGFLIGTLAKKSGGAGLPEETRYLYQEVDPVPLASYKVYTPWASYFKQSMVFVLGRLDERNTKIKRWALTVRDTTGQEIRTFGGVGNPPEAFAWNGRDSGYNPVAAGKAYIPEITLENFYGARATLPQKKMFYMDQFMWEDPLRMILAIRQDSLFDSKRAAFSRAGLPVVQEVSNLVNQQDAWVMDIECSGPDADLCEDRAQALKTYFARENLRLKNIHIKNSSSSGEAMVKITSLKPSARQAGKTGN
jgi:hypothetical protein